ncbi:hypothetical protein yaldo0001_33410 [Yersinia aldovae ATCC 35236]|nr:hypothetical protein yaldo0001_33410 [Yersinia aldovae ATCC 35236]
MQFLYSRQQIIWIFYLNNNQTYPLGNELLITILVSLVAKTL